MPTYVHNSGYLHKRKPSLYRNKVPKVESPPKIHKHIQGSRFPLPPWRQKTEGCGVKNQKNQPYHPDALTWATSLDCRWGMILSWMSKASIRSSQVWKSRWKTPWYFWTPSSWIWAALRAVVPSVYALH